MTAATLLAALSGGTTATPTNLQTPVQTPNGAQPFSALLANVRATAGLNQSAPTQTPTATPNATPTARPQGETQLAALAQELTGQETPAQPLLQAVAGTLELDEALPLALAELNLPEETLAQVQTVLTEGLAALEAQIDLPEGIQTLIQGDLTQNELVTVLATIQNLVSPEIQQQIQAVLETAAPEIAEAVAVRTETVGPALAPPARPAPTRPRGEAAPLAEITPQTPTDTPEPFATNVVLAAEPTQAPAPTTALPEVEAQIVPAAPRAGEIPVPPTLQPVAPPTNPAPPPDLARAVTEQIQAARVDEGRIRIELSPRGLGELEIDFALDNSNRPLVVVRAENPAVLQALRLDRDALWMALNDSGVSLGDADLQFGSFDDRDQPTQKEGDGGAAFAGELASDTTLAAPVTAGTYRSGTITASGIDITI